MICPKCATGDHVECKKAQESDEPNFAGLSAVSTDLQRKSWCYCQHKTTAPKRAAADNG